MNRLQYRNFVYSISGLVVMIVVATLFLFQRMWPFISSALRPTFRNFADACGCSQFVSATTFSWPILLSLLGLALIGLLILKAIVQSVQMFVRTYTFEKTLRLTVVNSTESKGIKIYRSTAAQPLAVCVGLITPRIYITKELETLLSPVELWAVIRHELDHAIHRDPLYRFILNSLQAFFPLFGRVFQHYQALPELAADEAIADDTALQRALIKILEANTTEPKLAATFFSVAELRINRLLGTPTQRPTSRWLVIFMVLFVGSLTASYQAIAKEDIQQTALSACMAEQPICQEIMTHATGIQATVLPEDEVFMSPNAQSQPFMNILTTEYFTTYEE